MSQPKTNKSRLHQQDHRLADFEAQAKEQLARIQADRAQLAEAIAAEEAAEAEAAVLAAKQGLPIDIAKARIAKARGQEPAGNDASKMSKQDYLAYRQRKHGF